MSESFFSQLGPNSNFGSQFAQTVTVKCSDAPSDARGDSFPGAAVLGLLLLIARARASQAETRPRDALRPLAAQGRAALGLRAQAAAPRKRAAPSAVFGWVLETQQSLQRDLATA